MPINSVGLPNNLKKNAINYNQTTKASETRAKDSSATVEEYLQDLKKVYPQVNFLVGNISAGNAKNFAFSGRGIHNIAVSKKYLQGIVKDPQKRLEFKESVQQTIEAQKWAQAMDKASGRQLVATGMIIDENGDMRSWCHSTRSSEADNNSINDLDSLKLIKSKQALLNDSIEKRQKRRKEVQELYEKKMQQREELNNI